MSNKELNKSGYKRGKDIENIDDLFKALKVNSIQDAKEKLGIKLSFLDKIKQKINKCTLVHIK